jgi:hypothetical protein
MAPGPVPYADLPYANLTNAWLRNANLPYVTFSFGTTLPDGQTVAQLGFDAAGLQVYLEARPVDAWEADNFNHHRPRTHHSFAGPLGHDRRGPSNAPRVM